MILRYVLGNLGCPDIPSKMRTKNKINYRLMRNQSHEMIKPVSNLSIPYVDSWQLIGEPDFTDLSLEKRKNESHSEYEMERRILGNLEKGIEVPVASAIIIHESPWCVPLLRHDLHTSQRLYSVYNVTTTCTMCTIVVLVILCYSGCQQIKSMLLVSSIIMYFSILACSMVAHYVWHV